MVRIARERTTLVARLFPDLKDRLRLAQMDQNIKAYARKCFILALIIALNITIPAALLLIKLKIYLAIPVLFIAIFIALFLLTVHAIPEINIRKIQQEIDSDIFVPSRMLLTLLEAGNSLITAIETVSYSKAKSGKYFGKIASEIYMGKSLEQAIDDAVKNTPSDSFRMVLQPIKKSIKTGTDIQKTLLATLQELQSQKIIEIEQYEKRLNPITMFYMIFGTIIPSLLIVAFALVLSVLGIKVQFFPILFIFLVAVLLVQLVFINIFINTRPMVKL